MAFQFLKTRVSLVLTDAQWPEAEGLLLPSNDYLWMAAGPALTIKQRAGEEVEIEAVRSGPVSLGQVVPTKSGALPFEAILHLAMMGQDLQLTEAAATSAMRAGIREASERKWARVIVHSFLATGRGTHREIAMPVLSTLVDELLEGGAYGKSPFWRETGRNVICYMTRSSESSRDRDSSR